MVPRRAALSLDAVDPLARAAFCVIEPGVEMTDPDGNELRVVPG